MNNPENSNPAVLGSMLEAYSGGGSEFYVAQIQNSQGPFQLTIQQAQDAPEYILSEGYTYQDINNAWNSGKTILIYLSDYEIAIRAIKNNNDNFTFYGNGFNFIITPENNIITENGGTD